MSIFSLRKSTGNESKSATLGSGSKQSAIQDANKKRTLLKDSSWIKSRPENDEEKPKDENYGKNILSRYKSQDDLDRDTENGDTKPIHNRFKSDDALDRISLKNTSERGNRSATLERFPTSENTEPESKRQPWPPGNKTTTPTEETKKQPVLPGNRTTTTTTTTEETKKQPWTSSNRNVTTTETTQSSLPGKQDGQKITIYSSDSRTSDKPRSNLIDSTRTRFEKTEEKPKPPPTPTSPVPKTDIRSPNTENKSFVMPKLSPVKVDEKSPNTENKSFVMPKLSPVKIDEKPQTNVDKPYVTPRLSPAKTEDKPSYPVKPPASQPGERRSVVERKQRSQDIDNLIDVTSTRKSSNKGDVDDLIEISSNAKNLRNRDEEFNNLIEIKKPQEKPRTQDLNNLIDVTSTGAKPNKGSQDLDDLIAITGDGNKGTARPSSSTSSSSSRNPTTTTSVTENIYDVPSRRSTTSTKVTENTYDLPGKRISTTYTSSDDPRDSTSRRSTTTTTTTTTYNTSNDTPDGTSRRTTTSYRSGGDITDSPDQSSTMNVVHTKSYTTPASDYYSYNQSLNDDGHYDRNSAYPNKYDDSVKTSSIKTVYSTADRAVIAKDMCTYCRRPLGLDAKMILKDMNISCHATCFKCEVCSGGLGGMKAGDSMWIYKQSIHCEPCYFKAKERWIM
uniref:Sciellin n=1 Tax=Leptobrachium leishanense TaxID=445787 RepID=A0A8C5LNR5_9ANUR